MTRRFASCCAVSILCLAGCATNDSSTANVAPVGSRTAQVSGLTAGDELGFALRQSDQTLTQVQVTGQ